MSVEAPKESATMARMRRPCPRCGAAVGEYCVTGTGKKSSEPHKERWPDRPVRYRAPKSRSRPRSLTREDVHGPEPVPAEDPPELAPRPRRALGPLGSRFAVESRLRDLEAERIRAWRSGEERNGDDEPGGVALRSRQVEELREVLDAFQALIDSARALLD